MFGMLYVGAAKVESSVHYEESQFVSIFESKSDEIPKENNLTFLCQLRSDCCLNEKRGANVDHICNEF